MSCLRRCLLGMLALAVVVAGLTAAALFFASSWLLQSDEPQAADAIVVLAGDARRARHTADLYRRGLAWQILVSATRADGQGEAARRAGHYLSARRTDRFVGAREDRRGGGQYRLLRGGLSEHV